MNILYGEGIFKMSSLDTRPPAGGLLMEETPQGILGKYPLRSLSQ